MTAPVQLPQILIRNSFNILGLSSSSTLKEIRKRSQQLLQLAKIEEVQEFDIDLGPVKEFRNESEIRLALERVSGIQERLKEIFFWFEDHRTESRKALEYISKGNYQNAISIFEASGSDWLDKKNFALALMFHAFASVSMDSFFRSLDVWKMIAESDNFWRFYEKHYLLHDELGTSPSLFEEFRRSFFEILSAKAVSFYRQTKNPEVVGACYSVFGRIGKIIDSEILQPIILKVKMEIEELEKTSDAPSQKKIIKKINKCFSELEEFELLDYSPIIVLKNDSAEKLRSIAVDIYNENADIDTARVLLDQSSKIAVSEVVLDKVESDKQQLATNEAWERVSSEFKKIKLLITDHDFQEAMNAYLALDQTLVNRVSELTTNIRIQLLINYCALIIQKGHELFENKRFGIEALALQPLLNRKSHNNAVKLFDQAIDLLKTSINIINFDDPAHDNSEVLKLIKEVSHSILVCEVSNLINHHEYCLSRFTELSETQTNSQTRELILLMGIASCFSSLYFRVREIMQGKMWKWIGYSAAILFYFLVVMNNDKPASKQLYKSSSYQTNSVDLTSQEQEAIEWFDILYENSLKSLRDKGHSDQKIARVILKKMKENGYSDVVEYLKDLETKAE